MKCNKLIAFAMCIASAVAISVSSAYAGETETNVISPTYDMQLRDDINKTYDSDSTTIELNGNAKMYGAMLFDIPSSEDGYRLSSATLTFVSERKKSTTQTYGIYNFGYTDSWTSESIKYSDVSSEVTTAINDTPLATFIPAGQYNKAVATDSGISNEYKNISAWTNTIDIPVNSVTGSKLSLLFSSTTSDNLQTKFYTKDATDVTNSSCNFTFTAEDLKPKLTLVYEKPVAKIGETYYYTFEDAILAVLANGTIELLDDVVLSDKILLKNDDTSAYKDKTSFTINGNGHEISMGESQNFLLEINSGYKVDLKNITLSNAYGKTVDIKSGGTLNATNTVFNGTSTDKPGLAVSGNAVATITDCTVTYLMLYGTLNLDGSSKVANVYLPNISTTDKPIININATTVVVTGEITVHTNAYSLIENYTLIPENYNCCTATYTDDTYQFVSGTFTLIDTISMTAEFIGSYTGTDSSTAVAYWTTFANNSDEVLAFDISSVAWYYNGNFKSTFSNDETTQISLEADAQVIYGVIVSGVSEEKALTAKIGATDSVELMAISDFEANEDEEEDTIILEDMVFDIEE